MKYLTTTYENLCYCKVDSLPEYCEVIGDIYIISFIQAETASCLLTENGHIPDTRKNLQNLLTIKGSYKNYRFILYQQGRRSYKPEKLLIGKGLLKRNNFRKLKASKVCERHREETLYLPFSSKAGAI